MPASGRGGSGGEATGVRFAFGTVIGVATPRLEPRVGGAQNVFPAHVYAAAVRRRRAWRKTNASTSATAAKNSSGIICPISTSR
jgi:hypothetical protein